MSKKDQKEHGFIGKLIRFLMVFIFFGIGVCLIALGSYCIAKNLDTYEGKSYRYVSIVNIVAGSLLLTSPFFLNQNRSGLNFIIKIVMTIIFVVFGLLLIILNSLAIANSWADSEYTWFPIVALVFGCLLFTAPFFLKKH